MPRVVTVAPLPQYRLHVEFDDGVAGTIDLSDELGGEVFQPLRDEALFRQVTVDEFGAVCWPNGPDLAPDPMHSQLAGNPATPAGPERGPHVAAMMQHRSVPLNELARFVAGLPPSVTRGTKPGVYKKATDFIRNNANDLIVGLAEPTTFASQLDSYTTELCKLSSDIRWGTARKCLNVFIRDAAYNVYLRNSYQLGNIEQQLELPLDKDAAKGLIADAKQLNLPKLPGWPGIIHLTTDESAQYQRAAAAIARRKMVARVHLDLLYWRADH